jgi:hypothetical protein
LAAAKMTSLPQGLAANETICRDCCDLADLRLGSFSIELVETLTS